MPSADKRRAPGQIGGHPWPLSARSGDPSEAIEPFAQGRISLRSVFCPQREGGGDKRPFFVRALAGIEFSGEPLRRSFSGFSHPSWTLKPPFKFITGSNENGWNRSDVSVSLKSTDEPGGSGVR